MRAVDSLVEQRFHSRSHDDSSSHESNSEFSSTSNSPSPSFVEANYKNSTNINNKNNLFNRGISAASAPITDNINNIKRNSVASNFNCSGTFNNNYSNHYNHTYTYSGSVMNMSDANVSFADKRLINFINSEEHISALDRLYLSVWGSVISLLATFVTLGGMLVLVAIPPLFMNNMAGKISYIAVMIPVLAIAGTLINYIIVEHPQLLLSHFMLKLARNANKYRVALEGHAKELNEVLQRGKAAINKERALLNEKKNDVTNMKVGTHSNSESTTLQEMVISVQQDGRALMRCVQDEVNWANAQIDQLDQICHAPLHPTIQREQRLLKAFLMNFGKLQQALLEAFKKYNDQERLVNLYYVRYRNSNSGGNNTLQKPLLGITSSFASSPSAQNMQNKNGFACDATPDVNNNFNNNNSLTNESREITSQTVSSPAEYINNNTKNNKKLNGKVSQEEKNAIHLPIIFQHSHGMVDLLDESLQSEQTPRSLCNDEHDSEFDEDVSNTHERNYSHVDGEKRRNTGYSIKSMEDKENKDEAHHYKIINTKSNINSKRNRRSNNNNNNDREEGHYSPTEELELQTASEFTIGGYSTAGLATSMELTSPSSRMHQQRRLDANFTFPEENNSNKDKDNKGKEVVQRQLQLSMEPSSSVYENSSTTKLADSSTKEKEKSKNNLKHAKTDEIVKVTADHKLITKTALSVPSTPVIRLSRGHRFYSDNEHVFFYVVIMTIEELTRRQATEQYTNNNNNNNKSLLLSERSQNITKEVFTFESHLQKVKKVISNNHNDDNSTLPKNNTNSTEFVFVLSNEKLPFQSFRVDLHERSKHNTMSTLQRRLISFLHCAEEVESEIEEEEQEGNNAGKHKGKRTRLDLSSLAYAANNSNSSELHNNNTSSIKQKKEENKLQNRKTGLEGNSRSTMENNGSNKTVNHVNYTHSSSKEDSNVLNSNSSSSNNNNKNTKFNSCAGETEKEEEYELPSHNSHRRCETMTEVYHDDTPQDVSNNSSSTNNILNGKTNLYNCDNFNKKNNDKEVKHNSLYNHSVSSNASMTSSEMNSDSHTEVDATEIEKSYHVASTNTAVTSTIQLNNNENNKTQHNTSNSINNNSSSYHTEAAIIMPSSHHLRKCGSYIMSWRAWPSKAMRLTYLEVELVTNRENEYTITENNKNKESKDVAIQEQDNAHEREVENEGHDVSHVENANSITIPHHVDPTSHSSLTVSSHKPVLMNNSTIKNKRTTVPVLEGVLNGVLCVITHAQVIVHSDVNSKIAAVEFHGVCIEDERNSRNISENSQRDNSKNNLNSSDHSYKERHVYEFGDAVVERKERKQSNVPT